MKTILTCFMICSVFGIFTSPAHAASKACKDAMEYLEISAAAEGRAELIQDQRSLFGRTLSETIDLVTEKQARLNQARSEALHACK